MAKIPMSCIKFKLVVGIFKSYLLFINIILIKNYHILLVIYNRDSPNSNSSFEANSLKEIITESLEEINKIMNLIIIKVEKFKIIFSNVLECDFFNTSKKKKQFLVISIKLLFVIIVIFNDL